VRASEEKHVSPTKTPFTLHDYMSKGFILHWFFQLW